MKANGANQQKQERMLWRQVIVRVASECERLYLMYRPLAQSASEIAIAYGAGCESLRSSSESDC